MAGFVTPMAPQMTNNMNIGVKHGNEGPTEDEPSNKKLRNEDSLIPEAVFLARNAVCSKFFKNNLAAYLVYRLLFVLEPCYN